MKKKSKIILAIVLAVILIPCILMYLRYRSNVALGEELRKEANAWLASLPQIPESENGAPMINKGLRMLDDLPENLWDEHKVIENEKEATQFRNFLSKNEKALITTDKGLHFEKWTFTTDYERGIWMTKPDMYLFNKAAKVYRLKGLLAEFEGRLSDALHEYMRLFHLAATLSRERLILSRAMRISLCTKGCKLLLKWDANRPFSDEFLEHALGKLLDFHKGRLEPAQCYIAEYHVSMMVFVDFLNGSKWTLEVGVVNNRPLRIPAWPRPLYDYSQDIDVYKRYLKLFSTIDPAQYHNLPKEVKDRYAFCEKVGIDPASRKPHYAEMLMPVVTELVKYHAEHETTLHGTIVLVAVRLYEAKNGSLPESLDKLGKLVPKELLIDPFSGKNLIYRREGDDFYLYSVGYNGVDDKCKDSRPIFEDGVDRESVPDIVFHTPLK